MYPVYSACTSCFHMASPTVQYFSSLSHKRHDFRKKIIEHKICGFSLQILSESFCILRIIKKDMNKNVHWSLYKESVIFMMF